jgi:hypothetical protein
LQKAKSYELGLGCSEVVVVAVVVLGAVVLAVGIALHVVQGIVSPHIRVPEICGQPDPVGPAV